MTVTERCTAASPDLPAGTATAAFGGRFRDQPGLRGWLVREALARAGHDQPGAHELGKSRSGKPWYADPAGRWGISLTHSRGVAMAAAARDRSVGIDVEQIRPRRFTAIASQLAWGNPPEHHTTFYRAWTLWEACIKAAGADHRALFEMLRTEPTSAHARAAGWRACWFQPTATHWGCLVTGPWQDDKP